MDLPLSFYLISALAIFLTGLSKSGFGGGLGVMAVPMMSLFVAPQFAAAVMMPLLLAMDMLVIWRYRRSWDRAIVLSLLPAACLGLILGRMTFTHMDANIIKLLIGLLAGFFVVQFLLGRKALEQPMPGGKPLVWALGVVSGFSSYIAHAGGPPVKGYLLRQQLEKSAFVGTNTVFFFTLNFLKTVAYGASGTLTETSLGTSLLLSPVLVVAVLVGSALQARIDQKLFVKFVYGFLALTAVKLLSDSLTAFLG